MSITVIDLYKVAALNAYIQRGFDMETAISLAQETARKMRDKDLEYLFFEKESYA